MIQRLYSIKDRVSGNFWSPWIDQNDSTAKRQFAMQINTSGTLFSFSPKDFELYHIGDFDSDKAYILQDSIDFICSGDDLVGAK